MKRKLALCAALAGCILCITSCRFNGTGDADSQGEVKEISLAPTATEAAQEETPEVTDAPEDKKQTSDKKSYPKITSKAKVESFGGTVKVGDSAYELYNYVDSYAKKYAAVVNNVASALKGRAQVYDMVVPTSVGITLPDNKRSKINSTPQKQAIKSIYKYLNSRVTEIDLYDTLMSHRDEYIYFRTDHHWTSKGAYYAYRAYCETKGLEPYELSQYEKKNFGTFLGTFYTDTNNSKSLRRDKVKAFYPVSNQWIKMTYRDESGGRYQTSVINDGTNYSTSLKYCAFIAGDNPFSVIRNSKIKDGSRCLVVKESYGNTFVPYLTDHYQTVYVVDYRYWTGSIKNLVKKKKIDDVIFLNNISMTRNAYLIGRMAQVK